MSSFSRKMKISAIGASVILGLGVSAAIMIPSANAQNPTPSVPTTVVASVPSVPSVPSISKMPSGSTAGDDAEINDGPDAVSSELETGNRPTAVASNVQSPALPAAITTEGDSENSQVSNGDNSENND